MKNESIVHGLSGYVEYIKGPLFSYFVKKGSTNPVLISETLLKDYLTKEKKKKG